MPKLARKDWPAEYRGKLCVAGIFVRGCVARGTGSSFRRVAHAHTAGPWKGWVCVRKESRVTEDREIMLHELAHLLTGEGHTDRWRRCLTDLGGTVRAIERKKPRDPEGRRAWWQDVLSEEGYFTPRTGAGREQA